ncbi:MAG: hypothetical protein PGN09_07535 [Sphingomonas fennica]
MRPASVVPETTFPTEAEFRAAMLAGLARAERQTSRKVLAFAMDVTTKQLGNIMEAGSMPAPKRLWDALGAEETALDDIARLYGLRLVPQDATCDSDDAGVVLASLLQALLKAEHPDSPGGRTVVPQELLGMETLVRAVHAKTGKMIACIDEHRRPRVVANG